MKSLYAKLAVVLLILFSIAALAYLGLTIYTTRRYMDEANQKLNRGLAATIAREKPVVHDGRIDSRMLDEVFDALMAVNPSIEIYLLDPRGNILAFSAPPGKVKRRSVAIVPIRRFLAGDRLPILGDDPRDLSRRKIFSATRVDDGYLYVILGGEQFDSVFQQLRASWILQQSTMIAIAATLLALVTGLILFAAIARRQQVEELQEVDRLRRELVANVSHDLRTPLSSLQGYLDTLLLKEGHLSAEEQHRFLEIATRHAERLGQLIDELFELAKLDAQTTPIRVEPFSMAELVQDVVQKFQLRAEQGGVALDAEIRPGLPLVSGDIALMERVLENLLDNALRHTPSGGRVNVALVADDGRMTVRVSDTGSGIAPEDLPHVFERFYRGPNGGAGLGLAIAQRILELHGTKLEVESRVNEGTTFAFRVAVSS